MKTINKYIFAIIITSFLLITGCTGNNSSGANQNSYSLDSFNGGKKALDFEFVEGMPPEKIKDNGLQPFQVRISARNEGEFDIEEGKTHVRLAGFNPDDLNINDTSKSFPAIRGFLVQGENIIPGQEQRVIFSGLKYVENLASGIYPLTINANLCYPYETRAIAEVCIAGNTIPTLEENYENCQIEGSKQFSNSGAPVYIENVEQFSNGGSSILMQFDIVHDPESGNGRVFKSNTIDSECNIDGNLPTKPEVIEFEDKIQVEVEGGLGSLDCESTGTNSFEAILDGNGRTTVTCIQDTSNQGDAYSKLFVVTLKYDYLDRISTVVNVEHIEYNR
jgi:hypothetical protein